MRRERPARKRPGRVNVPNDCVRPDLLRILMIPFYERDLLQVSPCKVCSKEDEWLNGWARRRVSACLQALMLWSPQLTMNMRMGLRGTISVMAGSEFTVSATITGIYNSLRLTFHSSEPIGSPKQWPAWSSEPTDVGNEWRQGICVRTHTASRQTHSSLDGSNEHIWQQSPGIIRVANIFECLGAVLANLREENLVTAWVLVCELGDIVDCAQDKMRVSGPIRIIKTAARLARSATHPCHRSKAKGRPRCRADRAPPWSPCDLQMRMSHQLET